MSEDTQQATDQVKKLIDDHHAHRKFTLTAADRRAIEIVVLAFAALKAERDRVASGKTTCADCGSLLARF